MKKKEKTVCQIIRFRGKIEAFLVSIDEFAISSIYITSESFKIIYDRTLSPSCWCRVWCGQLVLSGGPRARTSDPSLALILDIYWALSTRK